VDEHIAAVIQTAHNELQFVNRIYAVLHDRWLDMMPLNIEKPYLCLRDAIPT
jgi:hypothetical protein